MSVDHGTDKRGTFGTTYVFDSDDVTMGKWTIHNPSGSHHGLQRSFLEFHGRETNATRQISPIVRRGYPRNANHRANQVFHAGTDTCNGGRRIIKVYALETANVFAYYRTRIHQQHSDTQRDFC